MTPVQPRLDRSGVALRVGIYVFLALAGVFVFPWILLLISGNPFITSIFGVFCAAAVANAVALRVYERGELSVIGLGWTHASRNNVALGLLGGAGSALLVIFVPVILRFSDLVGSSRVDLQACKLEYSIVSPK